MRGLNKNARAETAHSLPPESAGSRSPEGRRQEVDALPMGSAQPVCACGVLILLNCRYGRCCTGEWWRRECAGEAGRSCRPLLRALPGANEPAELSELSELPEMSHAMLGNAVSGEDWSCRCCQTSVEQWGAILRSAVEGGQPVASCRGKL